jgi:nitroreductase
MLDILRRRRSIRHYTPEPLSPELLDQLKEAALRAPSSRGLDPWEFIFVTDRDLLTELATAKAHGAHFLRDAALGVVVLGNESQSDTWIEDCSIAAAILHLTTQSLDLGSCWVQIRLRQDQAGTCSEARVRQILNIPDTLRVASIMSIGHPAKAAKPHPRESLKDYKIKTGTYA